MHLQELENIVRQALEDIKAEQTVVIDVRERTPITDLVVVTTGNSGRHIQSIARHVVDAAKKQGLSNLAIEGDQAGSEWVLIDLGDVVLHVMTAESRDFYRLERMWEMDDEMQVGSG
ncbi:ribosome silencing factor [Halorhodospira halochloris]|uniref:Ribosomal silencing factor RsfS n=1 Tax=Halorhodospira halochloris TaxID=1052 RepID=A0A0X8XAM6_HALHR|nr:ribosome silencing factor [Halorhodospira halochloris]MBK1651697.1 ribosome silencing factor [Halorhodospira halochloris]MCG5529619.1 ribosome silencing factor [Halorhodospira halochloris]MCG5548102.1 ribosome silencing factor [Halorhodospira halochloris]BAU58560.1 iojap protein [Halorhodospira halochloris]